MRKKLVQVANLKMTKPVLKIRDIVKFGGNIVLLGKVKEGVIKEGMVTKIAGHKAKVTKIEKGGPAKKAKAGDKANIWIEGDFTREELETAVGLD